MLILSFPAKECISGQNSLKKSCLEHDFASKWSGRMSFGHEKCTELSPMDLVWPFKKCIIRISMVHHFSHVPGASTKLFHRDRLGKHRFFLFYFFLRRFFKNSQNSSYTFYIYIYINNINIIYMGHSILSQKIPVRAPLI